MTHNGQSVDKRLVTPAKAGVQDTHQAIQCVLDAGVRRHDESRTISGFQV
jgi:hypothetical protein